MKTTACLLQGNTPAIGRRGFLSAVARSAFSLGVGQAGLALASCADRAPVLAHPKPVVDTHMHVWSKDAKRFPFVHPYDPQFKGPPCEGTVEMLLEDMDRNGVSHAILVQVIFHGWDNRYIAECVRAHPGRFRAHGLIDPKDPAVSEKLVYWVKEHGLSGMRFSPIYYKGAADWLNAKSSDALWRKAEELGVVFNFFIGTSQLPKLADMIDRFPAVKVVIDHLAQADLKAEDPMPEFKKLLALARYPNTWVKVSELTSVSKSGEYPFVDAYPWVKHVYDAFGPDRLLWGTGYPGAARSFYKRPTLTEELALIRGRIPFFNAEDQDKVLGGNAARIWKLV